MAKVLVDSYEVFPATIIERLCDCVTFTARIWERTRQMQKTGSDSGLFSAADVVPCCRWPLQTRQSNIWTSHTHSHRHTQTHSSLCKYKIVHWCERDIDGTAWCYRAHVANLFNTKEKKKKKMQRVCCGEWPHFPLVLIYGITAGPLQMTSSPPIQQDNKWLLSHVCLVLFSLSSVVSSGCNSVAAWKDEPLLANWMS